MQSIRQWNNSGHPNTINPSRARFRPFELEQLLSFGVILILSIGDVLIIPFRDHNYNRQPYLPPSSKEMWISDKSLAGFRIHLDKCKTSSENISKNISEL